MRCPFLLLYCSKIAICSRFQIFLYLQCREDKGQRWGATPNGATRDKHPRARTLIDDQSLAGSFCKAKMQGIKLISQTNNNNNKKQKT